MKMLRYSLVAALLVVASTTSAKAGFVDTASSSPTGVLNTYHDTSFESIYYNDAFGGAHGLQAGDVVIGFNQINQKTAPGSTFTTNTIYDVFSETIQSVGGPNAVTQPGGYVTGGTVLNLAPTNSGPQSLQSILAGLTDKNGNPIVVPKNTIAMVFDRPQGSPYGTDLINNPPLGATSMASYIQYAAQNGTTEVAAGFAKANDFLAVNLSVPPATSISITNEQGTAGFLAGSTAQTFSLFGGGLSILQNNTPFHFGKVPLNGNTYDITVTSGTGVTDGSDSNYGTFALGNNPTGGGFKDSADFNFNVISPEPSSIVLLVLGCAGLLAGAYRQKRRTAVTV